jgi:multidrug efflux system outer membrane protein
MGMTEMKGKNIFIVGLLVMLLAGCTVGPNYKRPSVDVPALYRGTTTEQAASPQPVSFAEEKWSQVFSDDELRELIRTALEQNYDLRIAGTRILQARAQLGITRADQLPTVSAGAVAVNERFPESRRAPAFESSAGELSLSASWELDFWGRFRRATEAARAELVATEWARQFIVTTLIADVANAYFQLRELDLELEISKRTLASRQASLELIRLQEQHGAVSMLDVRQAEQLVFTASQTIPDLERRIEQQENFISVLLGRNPGTIRRGQRLTAQLHPPEVPTGLPSALLERRPDIRLVEHQLIAANARIGVARAAYFPQITLTGTGGYQSSSLAGLFSGPAGLWSLAAGLTQPIFAGGRIRSGVRLSEAQQQEALLTYQSTIQQAFREVADALIAYRKNQEFRAQQELLTRSAEDATRLSNMRYRGGATSYLEVLDSETRYFAAELNLAQAQLNELLAFVEVYRALGGGWE